MQLPLQCSGLSLAYITASKMIRTRIRKINRSDHSAGCRFLFGGCIIFFTGLARSAEGSLFLSACTLHRSLLYCGPQDMSPSSTMRSGSHKRIPERPRKVDLAILLLGYFFTYIRKRNRLLTQIWAAIRCPSPLDFWSFREILSRADVRCCQG